MTTLHERLPIFAVQVSPAIVGPEIVMPATVVAEETV
jgi:hypothetical protein